MEENKWMNSNYLDMKRIAGEGYDE